MVSPLPPCCTYFSYNYSLSLFSFIAVAGGMMVAASLSLVIEAANTQDETFGVLSMFPGIG
jgi:energy-converting hydrogenase Eha subunit E